MNLLSKSNFKLNKSYKFGYITYGLALAPNNQSGRNVCPHATPGCIKACNLWFSGHMVMKQVRSAMIARTNLFFDNRNLFMNKLYKELSLLDKLAKKNNMGAAVRLNTASDLMWEKLDKNLFSEFSEIKFYDYTKSINRVINQGSSSFPANYFLTYSYNEKSNIDKVKTLLKSGNNVAFVTDLEYNKNTGYMEKCPEFLTIGNKEYYTTDGDKNDLRLPDFDGRGRAIILRFKGSNKLKLEAIQNGFCIKLKKYTI